MFPEYVKFHYDSFADVYPDSIAQAMKDVYKQLYKGYRNRQRKISIKTDKSLISEKDVVYICRRLYYDTPSFFFVDTSSYICYETQSGYMFIRDFLYSDEEIDELERRILAGLKAFTEAYIKPGMSDYEKEKTIHNYLVHNISYDYDAIKSEETRAANRQAYNIVGPLLQKKGVCMGIACTFKLLCDYVRVKCFVISGDTRPYEKNSNGHAWNVVKLDGETYHVDVTWDLRTKGDMSCIYDYFNLDDHLMGFDHKWDDPIYPACNALAYNYHNRNKLYVRSLAQISDYVKRKVLSGRTYITFKFAGKMPSEEAIYDEVRKGVRAAGCNKMYYRMINMTTHNIYIEFR